MKIFFNNIPYDMEEKNFYKEVAQLLQTESGVVEVIVPGRGQATYLVQKRSGTNFITESSNTLDIATDFKEVYLTCIIADKNSYKYYHLVPDGNTVVAKYGRMGSNQERSFTYPLSMFWVKYYEKLSKGYVDRSDIYLEKKVVDSNKVTKRKDTIADTLFNKLAGFSRLSLKVAQIETSIITKNMIATAKEYLNNLRTKDTVQTFNNALLELMAISQRYIGIGNNDVSRYLLDPYVPFIEQRKDVLEIINREETLIKAMEGSYYSASSNKVKGKMSFKDYDIKIFIATDKQKQQVLNHLSDNLKGHVKEIYRVIPKYQKQKFDEYLKEHKIKKVKQFWHGSRNENWLSIMINSLQLNPNAVITGKMFGQGIYFAPSSMKSWNYTSFRGTSWAGGKSNTAFMGLYATAYGKPFDVNTWDGSTDYKAKTKLNKCDCLHAHAGSSLRNDEIIFYNEEAMLLQYIVEFEE